MIFSSLEFLYLFLPLCVIFYFLAPRSAKNYVLLAASILFYAFSGLKYLPLLLCVSLTNFFLGLYIDRALTNKCTKRAKIILALSVFFNVGALFVFKYLSAILSLFGITVKIDLPPGISFYTFQAMSYVLDVYRRTSRPQKDPLVFVTYVTLFPQLVAGPIVRYSELDLQIAHRTHSMFMCADGIRLFLIGLAKKVLLANPAGEEFDRLILYSKTFPSVMGSYLALIFFAFQIYFDFSGYSDMARGLGKIFGFEFPENFRYPYISKSITEFWRRWHITLSSYFKEYVYISLGGSRHGLKRMIVSLLAVWSLTGLWHGASLNFLLWGLYFFAILLAEKLFLLSVIKKTPTVIQRSYALFFILVGWLIFCCDGVTLSARQGLNLFLNLFGVSAPLFTNDALFELWRHLPFLFICAVASTPLPARAAKSFTEAFPRLSYVFLNASAVLSLVICTCYLAASSYNPFLYFRF